MTRNPELMENATNSSPMRRIVQTTPKGHRVLHVTVPEPAFNNAKAQAYLSGMRFPDYVTRILMEARPYPDSASPSSEEQHNHRS